jgi:SnoaL-like polyketide cyclase
VMAMLHRAFTDLHITVEDLIADGDKVVGRTTATGTHQGEYMGLPPTCKSVAHNEIFVFRFVNGHIAEIFMGSSTTSRKCNSSAWSLRQRKEAYLVAEMNACCRLIEQNYTNLKKSKLPHKTSDWTRLLYPMRSLKFDGVCGPVCWSNNP